MMKVGRCLRALGWTPPAEINGAEAGDTITGQKFDKAKYDLYTNSENFNT